MNLTRPYYHEFAWAYDLLQTDPVVPRMDFIQSILSHHGVTARSSVLDAGCGTGRYAAELARRGFEVLGVDQSVELITMARQREPGSVERAQFVVADLLAASFRIRFDAILCRGALNDFVDDSERRRIFHQFETWLRPGGVLVFDVREWTRTVERYVASRVHRRTLDLPTGKLEFQSETVLDLESHGMRLHEQFDVVRNGVRTSTESDFVMRCWTSEEITAHLSEAGMDPTATYSTYGESDMTWSDRLVVVALKRNS